MGKSPNFVQDVVLKHIDGESRKLLLDHASRYDKSTAFTDDALTSKKILPGYKPRLASSKWVRWLTVAHSSFKLMLDTNIRNHEETAVPGPQENEEPTIDEGPQPDTN